MSSSGTVPGDGRLGTFLLGRIETFDGYLSVIVPGVIVVGSGGLALSVAVNLGIHGARGEDAGVASARVSIVQHLGGAVGPSLFNTSPDRCWPATSRLAPRATQTCWPPPCAPYSVSFDLAAAVLLGAAIARDCSGFDRPTTDDRQPV